MLADALLEAAITGPEGAAIGNGHSREQEAEVAGFSHHCFSTRPRDEAAGQQWLRVASVASVCFGTEGARTLCADCLPSPTGPRCPGGCWHPHLYVATLASFRSCWGLMVLPGFQMLGEAWDWACGCQSQVVGSCGSTTWAESYGRLGRARESMRAPGIDLCIQWLLISALVIVL